MGLDDAVQGRRAVQRRDLQRTRMVVVGAQVDPGTRRRDDVPLRAFQLDVAAPAVARLLEEVGGLARQIEARLVAQDDVALGRRQDQSAAGQGDGGVRRDAGGGHLDLGSQLRLGRLGDGGCLGGGQVDGPARLVVQAGAGLARQQRRGQVQHAALPRLTVNGLGLIDGQLALVVALDPLRGRQVDGAEAQSQPVHRRRVGDRHPVLVTHHDAVGDQVQRTHARSRAVGDRRPRLTGNDGRAVARSLCAQNAVPDQGSGRDLGHVPGPARAIEGRRVQHQLQGRNASGGVTGVQTDGAVEVDRLAGRQDQALQPGRARALIARHQAVQHGLVQGDARRQDAVLARRGQGLARPDVHRGRREGQIARAIVDVLAQADRARRDEAERAVGIEGGAVLDRDDAGGARRGVAVELQQAVGHRQQVHIIGPQAVAHGRVESRIALAQGRDAGAVLHQNVGVTIGDQQDLRPLQNRALAQGDAAETACAEADLVRPAAACNNLDFG